ncbi:MAG: hypothetical protein WA957_00730 [Alteraurantiacibacter sp.]
MLQANFRQPRHCGILAPLVFDRICQVGPSHNNDGLIVIVGIDSSNEEVLDLTLHRAVLCSHFAGTEAQPERLAYVIMVIWREDVEAGVHCLEAVALDQHLAPVDLGSLRTRQPVACHLAHHVHRDPLANQGQRGREQGCAPAAGCLEREA